MRRLLVLATLVLSAAALTSAQAPTRLPPAAAVTLSAPITVVAALGASSNVAAGTVDGRVVVWNGRDAAAAVTLKPHTGRVLALGSSPHGDEVWSIAVDGSVARTSVDAGAAPATIRIDVSGAPPRAAAFSSDGATVAIGGEFGEIRVFDTKSGTLKHRLKGHRTELQALAMRPGSSVLASAGAEADLRIWDTSSGREIVSFESDLSLFALTFSPRDGMLASGGVDRRVTLRDPRTFKPMQTVTLEAPRLVATLAWSPDGRYLAVGDVDDMSLSTGAIDVLNAATGSAVATLDTGRIPVAALTFTGDGARLIAIVGPDLRAWRLPSGRGSAPFLH